MTHPLYRQAETDGISHLTGWRVCTLHAFKLFNLNLTPYVWGWVSYKVHFSFKIEYVQPQRAYIMHSISPASKWQSWDLNLGWSDFNTKKERKLNVQRIPWNSCRRGYIFETRWSVSNIRKALNTHSQHWMEIGGTRGMVDHPNGFLKESVPSFCQNRADLEEKWSHLVQHLLFTDEEAAASRRVFSSPWVFDMAANSNHDDPLNLNGLS